MEKCHHYVDNWYLYHWGVLLFQVDNYAGWTSQSWKNIQSYAKGPTTTKNTFVAQESNCSIWTWGKSLLWDKKALIWCNFKSELNWAESATLSLQILYQSHQELLFWVQHWALQWVPLMRTVDGSTLQLGHSIIQSMMIVIRDIGSIVSIIQRVDGRLRKR